MLFVLSLSLTLLLLLLTSPLAPTLPQTMQHAPPLPLTSLPAPTPPLSLLLVPAQPQTGPALVLLLGVLLAPTVELLLDENGASAVSAVDATGQ
jgi:hypothetical protein